MPSTTKARQFLHLLVSPYFLVPPPVRDLPTVSSLTFSHLSLPEPQFNIFPGMSHFDDRFPSALESTQQALESHSALHQDATNFATPLKSP